MADYIKYKMDENGAKAFQKLPTYQDIGTIKNYVDLQYLQNVNKEKLLEHNIALDTLPDAQKSYDYAQSLGNYYCYDILGPDGTYHRINNDEGRRNYINECKKRLDKAISQLDAEKRKINKQLETVAKYKEAQKLKDLTKAKINDKKKKMPCAHGTNLDALCSVVLKTDGYLLPYSKLFKLGKKN